MGRCDKINEPERLKDDGEMYSLSLVPKMKELDSIAKLECQSEVTSVLVKYAMKRNAFSTTPERTQDSVDSTIHHTPRLVGPSVSSPHDVCYTNAIL